MNTLPSTRSPAARFPAKPRWSPLALLVAMLAACGGDPPEYCGDDYGTIELNVRKSRLIQPKFCDPESEDLTITVRSSDISIATAVPLDQSVRIKAIYPGNATITVTAEDPGGQTASIDIAVLVPNRAPISFGSIDGIRMLVGGRGVRIVEDNFDDLDDQELTFTARPMDPSVASAEIVGDIKLSVTGLALGSTTAIVTATDPGGLTAELEVGIDILEPVQILREDFDSNNGGFIPSWFASQGDYFSEPGLFRLRGTRIGFFAWATRNNVVAGEWEWKARLGQEEKDQSAVPGLVAEHAGGESPVRMFLQFGYSDAAMRWFSGQTHSHNWGLYYFIGFPYRTESGLWGESEAVVDGGGELMEVTFKNRFGMLSGMVGSTVLFEGFDMLARNWATQTVLLRLQNLTLNTNNWVVFDWVELNGLPPADQADWHDGPADGSPDMARVVAPGIDIPGNEILK